MKFFDYDYRTVYYSIFSRPLPRFDVLEIIIENFPRTDCGFFHGLAEVFI